MTSAHVVVQKTRKTRNKERGLSLYCGFKKGDVPRKSSGIFADMIRVAVFKVSGLFILTAFPEQVGGLKLRRQT